MTTKQLTSRQARWAEILSQFFFTIMYRPGRQNAQADALTRREQDVEPQDELKAQYRTRALLQLDQLDPAILRELLNELPNKLPNKLADSDVLAIEVEELHESIGLID